MTAFWVHLHRLAQGQLFNGGYLDSRALQPTKAPETPQRAAAGALRDTTAPRLPRTQLVGCR